MEEFEQAIEFKQSMVTLLSHTSHVFQPLDMTYFKPFKNAFEREFFLLWLSTIILN
jgi:hypothetical protein